MRAAEPHLHPRNVNGLHLRPDRTYESLLSWKCCSKKRRIFSEAKFSSPVASPFSHLKQDLKTQKDNIARMTHASNASGFAQVFLSAWVLKISKSAEWFTVTRFVSNSWFAYCGSVDPSSSVHIPLPILRNAMNDSLVATRLLRKMITWWS